MADPDYIYDQDDWECTYEWGMRNELIEDDPRLRHIGDVRQFSTLIAGPPKFAAHVVVSVDDAGEPDETEIRWFDTEAEARAACGVFPVE